MKETSNSIEERALARFSEMMIEKIKSINVNWQKPWFCAGSAQWATNLSGREYNGMNAFMLMMLCEEQGYDVPVFATFDRITSLNFKKDKQGKLSRIVGEDGAPLEYIAVKKGEKSFPVFMTIFSVRHKETGEKVDYDNYVQMSQERRDQYKVYPSMRVYYVFNICAQTNLKEARPDLYDQIAKRTAPVVPVDDGFSYEPLDRMVAGGWLCPIKPVHGNDAYYSISKDEIVVPEKSQFKSGESFYGNLLHEMAHSTGAEKRLNRLAPTSFGSAEYAREELVAEMTAALVSSRFGFEKYVKDDSAPYLKSWLSSLKKDPSFIKSVLLDVKRASQLLVSTIEKQ